MFVTLLVALLFCVRGSNADSVSPKILQNFICKVQLNVLTCVCVAEGFPLTNITWPLLQNHTEYSIMTTVSDHTVNSTITLTMKDHSNATVECVIAPKNGEATKKNLGVHTGWSDLMYKFREALNMVSWLVVVIAFLTGVLLSTVVCCFFRYCHRKNKKNFVNPDETVEMINVDQAVKEHQTYNQETAEEGGRAGSEEKAALDPNGVPEDLHYASIDFEERKSTANMPEYTETEYAEVK